MRTKRLLLGLLIAAIGCREWARPQTGMPAEPEYINQFFVLGSGGQLTPLEREPMHHAIKRKNIPFIKVDIESRQDVDGGPASPIHVGPAPHFIVKMRTGDVDPTTLIHLVQFKVDKQGRYAVTGDQQGFVFTNGKSSGQQGNTFQLKIVKYGQSSLDVQPAQPLPAGEYALVINPASADCFSVDPSIASNAPSPASSSTAAAATRAAPVWKLKPVDHPDAITDSYEATLAGTAEANGKRGAAQLDLTCTIKRFTGPDGTTANENAALKVRREMVGFPPDGLTCEGDGAVGAAFLHSQLGTDPEQTRNLCFDGEYGADPRAVLSFGLGYEDALLMSIVQTSGQQLSLKIRPQEKGPEALAASFQLPANGTEVLAAFDPCLKILEAQRKKEADAIVVACPAISGKALADVSVLTGPALKKLTPDPENDIGVAWDMPKATKAHPVVPKLTLACAYIDAAGSAAGTAGQERKLLPIPATAKYCVFRQDENTNAPYGNCSK